MNRPLYDESRWDLLSFRTTTPFPPFYEEQQPNAYERGLFGRCATHYRTLGLLGTYNGDVRDDITTPDCIQLRTVYPQTEHDARSLYYDFGEKWRLDRNLHLPKLFQSEYKPIYDPLSFASPVYTPIFDAWLYTNYSLFETFVFSREEVRVTCQGVPSCESDYLLSGRREMGLETLDFEKKAEVQRERGEQRCKCRPHSI